jgi:predicted transcriptional regulator
MVGAKVRALPELREISQFFTAELSAQLADARGPTTSKLDAPVNKLARLLNSPSIKRVLLNDSLRVDFDRVIADGEVLVVKGALGGMGAGNTAVLMQLLVGMLDAALARQQDMVPEDRRIAVALKIDEAPLVLNRGFAETMALKRSAGLETVACWQTDAQWVDREVRDQLDALFAHRVYFATASAKDARSAAALTMAEFSDSVRPDTRHLSSLGRPDVRLRLPRHHAIVSWSTAEGRQPAFIAQTIAMQVDRARLALHEAAQRARGGRSMDRFDQPHWEPSTHSKGDPLTAVASTSPTQDAESSSPEAPPLQLLPPLPDAPAESYRELAELDLAQSTRRVVSPPAARVSHDADRLDLEVLALIADMGYLLTSQIHRRFNPDKALTTTQRRLKRLADAGLVERLQFHRRDGGGVPMCYAISRDGLWLLEANAEGPEGFERPAEIGPTSNVSDRSRLDIARRQIHASGWALELCSRARRRSSARGADRSVLHPPRAPTGGRALAPSEIHLPGGRVAHEFLSTDASGRRVETERFETIRPDATVVLDGEPGALALDILLDFDDRIGRRGWACRVERYDHFLSGWSVNTHRYGPRGRATALVVFVCRDRARARRCALEADSLLGACRAYAGEYPVSWEYPGRSRVLFTGERDVHEGITLAYGVATLPQSVRVAQAGGDLRAGEASVVAREIELGSERSVA